VRQTGLSPVHEHRRALARSSSGIAVLAGAGVLSGFLVDAAMAAIFGADAGTDAFFIAATIPFALASLLLASVNQVIVPVVHRWFDEGSEEEARLRVGGLLGTALAGGVGVASIGIALSPLLPAVLAPGAASDTKRAAVQMTALLFTTVVTRIGAEILRSLLNARFSFAGPAAMPLIENGAVLGAIVLLAGRIGIPAVAVGYVVGGVLQLAFIGILAAARGLLVVPTLRFRDPEIRAAFRLMALPLSGTGLTMVARAAERFLASFLPTGQLTILNYAWRVVNSIGGAIFFRSVVVALLPRLSAAREDAAATRRIVTDGINLMSLISLPLTAFVVVLAQPLVMLAFQRGAFDAEATALLASVVAVYALQFPFDALNRVYVSYWYARFDTVVPFANVALGVGLDIVFAVVLFFPLGIHGIALGYVVSSVGYLIHGARSVHRRIELPGRSILRTIVRVSVATIAAGGASALVLFAIAEGPGLVDRLIRLAVPGSVGVVVLAIALAALRFRIWGLLRPGATGSGPR
jgi:putative peptidoglycan lipid II flippase